MLIIAAKQIYCRIANNETLEIISDHSTNNTLPFALSMALSIVDFFSLHNTKRINKMHCGMVLSLSLEWHCGMVLVFMVFSECTIVA